MSTTWWDWDLNQGNRLQSSPYQQLCICWIERRGYMLKYIYKVSRNQEKFPTMSKFGKTLKGRCKEQLLLQLSGTVRRWETRLQ